MHLARNVAEALHGELVQAKEEAWKDRACSEILEGEAGIMVDVNGVLECGDVARQPTLLRIAESWA
jgi:hypothetical protein